MGNPNQTSNNNLPGFGEGKLNEAVEGEQGEQGISIELPGLFYVAEGDSAEFSGGLVERDISGAVYQLVEGHVEQELIGPSTHGPEPIVGAAAPTPDIATENLDLDPEHGESESEFDISFTKCQSFPKHLDLIQSMKRVEQWLREVDQQQLQPEYESTAAAAYHQDFVPKDTLGIDKLLERPMEVELPVQVSRKIDWAEDYLRQEKDLIMAESDQQGIGQGRGARETTDDLTEATDAPEITYQDLIASIYNAPPSSSSSSSSAILPHSSGDFLQEYDHASGRVINNKAIEMLTQNSNEGSDGTGVGRIGHAGGYGRGGFFGFDRGLQRVTTKEPAVFNDPFIGRGRGNGRRLLEGQTEEKREPISPLLAQVVALASDPELKKEADTEFATCLYTEHGHLVPKDQLDCRYKICTAHLKFIQGMEKAEYYWRKSVQPKGRVRVVGGKQV